MRLRDFFAPDAIDLQMPPGGKKTMLAGLVALLHLERETSRTLIQMLERREEMGSTGVGRGIAIPHCRAPMIPQLRLAFGRVPHGCTYEAIDGQPVHFFFLIVAPPLEVSNLYLPVLGRLAQFAKGPDVPEKLAALTSNEEFFELLDQRAM